jgi:para-nitrobenzyl esterase
MVVTLLTALLATVVIGLPTQDAWSIGQEVETTSGKLTGVHSEWPANSGVSAYLGIPFAQPPVGELRWKKPEPFKGTGSIKADKFVSTG